MDSPSTTVDDQPLPMKEIFHFRLKNGDSATLDVANNQLSINPIEGESRSFTLAYAETRLLQLLLVQPGAIRSRNEIMDFAWEGRVVTAGSLNQAIFTLRNLINDGRDHELLQTVPRRGYRFNVGYVEGSDDATGSSSQDANSIDFEDITPLWERFKRAVDHSKPTRRVLIIPLYILMLCIFAFLALNSRYLMSGLETDFVVTRVDNGLATYYFIGEDAEENKRNIDFFKATLDTKEEGMAGLVWVNKSNRLYDLSCVRADGRTGNVLFSETNQAPNLPLNMVKKCLRGDQ